jgi:hypothetical protein
VESEDQASDVLLTLEKDGWAVVRRDWRKHVGEEVAADLRKYRNYRGHSVRDLLRALRNKVFNGKYLLKCYLVHSNFALQKHHYRDLSEEARQSLGEPPTEFLHYWTVRFPLLLVHSWLAMQCVKQEKGLNIYYHPTFIFPKVIACIPNMFLVLIYLYKIFLLSRISKPLYQQVTLTFQNQRKNLMLHHLHLKTNILNSEKSKILQIPYGSKIGEIHHNLCNEPM